MILLPVNIFNIFFFETSGLIEAKFHVEPTLVGGTKVCSQGLGYMTKMVAMPIIWIKLLKNLLIENRKADVLETWYVPLRTALHHDLYK